MQKITPFLWFDTEAEDAVAFYLSVFKDAKIITTAHYPENGPRLAGMVMTIAFELHGEQFVALNGGPGYPFTNAVSLVVNCESQEEIVDCEPWDFEVALKIGSGFQSAELACDDVAFNRSLNGYGQKLQTEMLKK